MEFTVRFQSKSQYAVSIQGRETGVADMDSLRQEVDYKLCAKNMHKTILEKNSDIEIIISEEHARKSGHFEHKNLLCIEVPIEGLNPFVSLRWVVFNGIFHRKYSMCACKEEHNNPCPCTQKIAEAWAKDGYPLSWKP